MDRHLVAALALLLAFVAGSGDATTEDGGPSQPSPTSESPAAPGGDEPAGAQPPGDVQPVVTAISMQRRGGGLAGVFDSWRLAPGDTFSDRAFELAARRAALEAESARLDNEPVCCDFFVYRLSVHYEDGTFDAVVDDDPEARLIWELVGAVASTSRAQPDKQQS
jgi:hypothetical protein